MQLQGQISAERYDGIARRAKQELAAENLFYFGQRAGLKLNGNLLSFEHHEYLEEIWNDISRVRDLTIEKAAQMGVSTVEIIDSIHGCQYGRYPQGVLYLLPSRSDVTEFSKTKVQAIVDENPLLQSWIQETNSEHIKKINEAYLYFRGMRSRVGLKVITVNKIVFDEVEEIEDPSLIGLAMERMSHVEEPFVHRISVPSLPEVGIDKFFQRSDQRYWVLICPYCKAENCLEDEFPHCLIEIEEPIYEGAEGKAIRACRKCRRELDISQGRWIPRSPSRSARGYHLSQLFSAFVNPWTILNWYRNGKSLTTLYNDKLGISYAKASARLEVQTVLSLCGGELMLERFAGPAAMGVDQPKEEGGKFHIAIGFKRAENLFQVCHLTIREKWRELDDLMRQFGIKCCVVDGLPDQQGARAFAQRHLGKVFLNFYSEHQKGAYKWDDAKTMVTVNRTESIDASQNALLERRVILPRQGDEINLFARHCHNMAKRKEEDEEAGSVRYVWVKLGEDHYRHAFNYMVIATGEIAVYRPPRPRAEMADRSDDYNPLTFGLRS